MLTSVDTIGKEIFLKSVSFLLLIKIFKKSSDALRAEIATNKEEFARLKIDFEKQIGEKDSVIDALQNQMAKLQSEFNQEQLKTAIIEKLVRNNNYQRHRTILRYFYPIDTLYYLILLS